MEISLPVFGISCLSLIYMSYISFNNIFAFTLYSNIYIAIRIYIIY